MKEEFLEAYQRRIEEIKTLDASPEEKRKLAADAKDEILEQYRNSYIKEKEQEARSQVEAKSEVPMTKKEDSESTIPVDAEVDPIDNIINKLEEREERGEVGIQIEEPTAFLDPNALFATMDLGDLFADDDEEESTEVGADEDIKANFDNIFMDTEQLFAGLFDDEEEQVEESTEVDEEALLNEFDLDADDEEQVDEETVAVDEEPVVEETVAVDEEPVVEETVAVDEEPVVEETVVESEIDETQIVSSLETDVVEVEELVEGSIADEEELLVTDSEELDPESLNELEELEKERERAQRIGIIEIALLIVLIILVIIVVYLIIGV